MKLCSDMLKTLLNLKSITGLDTTENSLIESQRRALGCGYLSFGRFICGIWYWAYWCGILWYIGGEVREQNSQYSFVFASVYLLPENSLYGRDANSFYSHLLNLFYLNTECDAFYIPGDLNAESAKNWTIFQIKIACPREWVLIRSWIIMANHSLNFVTMPNVVSLMVELALWQIILLQYPERSCGLISDASWKY